MTSSATSSGPRPRLVPVGVTEVTGTRLRFTRECFRTEPLSREGESGLEVEVGVGAQTREGGGKGADREDGGQELGLGPEEEHPGLGLEEEQPGQGLGTAEDPEVEGVGRGPGAGGDDEAQDLGEEEARAAAGPVRRKPKVAVGPNLSQRVRDPVGGSTPDLQCRAS